MRVLDTRCVVLCSFVQYCVVLCSEWCLEINVGILGSKDFHGMGTHAHVKVVVRKESERKQKQV